MGVGEKGEKASGRRVEQEGTGKERIKSTKFKGSCGKTTLFLIVTNL